MVTTAGAQPAPHPSSGTLTVGEQQQRFRLSDMGHDRLVAWLSKHGDSIAALGRQLP